MNSTELEISQSTYDFIILNLFFKLLNQRFYYYNPRSMNFAIARLYILRTTAANYITGITLEHPNFEFSDVWMLQRIDQDNKYTANVLSRTPRLRLKIEALNLLHPSSSSKFPLNSLPNCQILKSKMFNAAYDMPHMIRLPVLVGWFNFRDWLRLGHFLAFTYYSHDFRKIPYVAVLEFVIWFV